MKRNNQVQEQPKADGKTKFLEELDQAQLDSAAGGMSICNSQCSGGSCMNGCGGRCGGCNWGGGWW